MSPARHRDGALRRPPRSPRGAAGFTVVEVALAMAVMMVVLLMGMKAAGTALDVGTQVVDKGQATTEVVASVDELRQEIISANVIFDPQYDVYTSSDEAGNYHAYSAGTNYAGTNADGTAIPAGWSLRIYTQLNGNPMCAQWRVLDDGDLQTRTWTPSFSPPPGEQGVVHPWSTLATNVVNGAGQPPFALNYGSNYGGASSRLVDISFVASPGNVRVADDTYQTSIAARDAEYYPANTGDCYPVPTP